MDDHQGEAKLVPPAWRRRRVWTTKRKVMGNLVPFLLGAPVLAFGLWWMYDRKELLGWGLLAAGVSPVVFWVALNYLGLFQNRKMKREMRFRLQAEREKLPARRYFVGVATPTYIGWLDPHEDVGYLIVHPGELEFFGDTLRVRLKRSEVTGIRFKPNVHSLLGLGRWIAIEGISADTPVRLCVEPRERHNLLSNRLFSKHLRKRLERWAKSPIDEPATEAEPEQTTLGP